MKTNFHTLQEINIYFEGAYDLLIDYALALDLTPKEVDLGLEKILETKKLANQNFENKFRRKDA